MKKNPLRYQLKTLYRVFNEQHALAKSLDDKFAASVKLLRSTKKPHLWEFWKFKERAQYNWCKNQRDQIALKQWDMMHQNQLLVAAISSLQQRDFVKADELLNQFWELLVRSKAHTTEQITDLLMISVGIRLAIHSYQREQKAA